MDAVSDMSRHVAHMSFTYKCTYHVPAVQLARSVEMKKDTEIWMRYLTCRDMSLTCRLRTNLRTMYRRWHHVRSLKDLTW
jgi:hypothetical protein